MNGIVDGYSDFTHVHMTFFVRTIVRIVGLGFQTTCDKSKIKLKRRDIRGKGRGRYVKDMFIVQQYRKELIENQN